MSSKLNGETGKKSVVNILFNLLPKTPVEFTDDMVKHENSGQIGMSYRFVFSKDKDFDFANEFLTDNKEFKNPQRKRF
jgi:hypothetical protein